MDRTRIDDMWLLPEDDIRNVEAGASVAEDDELLFASETDPVESAKDDAWKVVIADDDEEVHALTRMVLSGFTFEDRGLSFVSAYTGEDTIRVMRENPDAALLLLDVVMEKEDAGLQAAKAIREDLFNPFVRIILRTGQPGQAPERDVVANYDINDYKAKTDLTAQRLFTTVTAALRAYRDLRTIENHRKGLEMLNDASVELFMYRTLDMFAESVLSRLVTFLQIQTGCAAADVAGYVAEPEGDHFKIRYAIGAFGDRVGRSVCDLHGRDACQAFLNTGANFCGSLGPSNLFFPLGDDRDKREIILIESPKPLNVVTRDLLGTYLNNVATAYRNAHLNHEIVETQVEMIKTLGETVESRSHETAEHVDRVAEYAYKLALLNKLDEDEAILLKTAAPLHDVGKIAIPDAILNKPGRYTDEERSIMKTHAELGYRLLCRSSRDLFRAAAIVAHQHHERWDGKGYPRGLAGEEIHIYGRIVGLVDVVDALTSERVYKDAFSLEKSLEIIREGRGTQFDPDLVDLMMANIEVFFPDSKLPDGPAGAPVYELLGV